MVGGAVMSKDSVAQKKVRPLNKVWATPRKKKKKKGSEGYFSKKVSKSPSVGSLKCQILKENTNSMLTHSTSPKTGNKSQNQKARKIIQDTINSTCIGYPNKMPK